MKMESKKNIMMAISLFSVAFFSAILPSRRVLNVLYLEIEVLRPITSK
jgi:hypothetical protein